MHVLAPDNTDALFMLTKGWVGYGFGFVEDEMEAAEDAGDDDLADYQRKRARMAYDRAVFYGLQLLAQRADGFEQAKKNELTLAKWLSDNFTSTDDAENLFWTGYGWLARVNLMKGDDTEGPAFIADLYVGVAMLERAVALDPSIEHYSGLARPRRVPRAHGDGRDGPGQADASTPRWPRPRARTSWSSSTTRRSTPA